LISRSDCCAPSNTPGLYRLEAADRPELNSV
jgi:hypothetical protein